MANHYGCQFLRILIYAFYYFGYLSVAGTFCQLFSAYIKINTDSSSQNIIYCHSYKYFLPCYVSTVSPAT